MDVCQSNILKIQQPIVALRRAKLKTFKGGDSQTEKSAPAPGIQVSLIFAAFYFNLILIYFNFALIHPDCSIFEMT
jgi:hypothetical protein